jgi:hypothetical protein
VLKPYKKNSKFGGVTPPIYCELSDGNDWVHDATLKHPLFYFLKYLMLRSNLSSSTSHTANLLRNLLKSPLQTSCLDWIHGLQTHKQRSRKRSCSHTYCVGTGEDSFKDTGTKSLTLARVSHFSTALQWILHTMVPWITDLFYLKSSNTFEGCKIEIRSQK